MIHVVDTHAIVWFIEKSQRLGKAARDILADPQSALVVPTIVLAEIRYLATARRITPEWLEIRRAIRSDARFSVFELDLGVVDMMPIELDIHDAIIVSTALTYKDILFEDTAVITKDRRIVASGLVPTVW